MRQKASNYTAFRIITSMTTSGLGSYATYIFFARTRIFHPNILIGQKTTRRSRRVGFVQKSKMHQTWNQSILIGRTTSRRNWCVQAGTSRGHHHKPHPWISWESWGRTRRVGLGHMKDASLIVRYDSSKYYVRNYVTTTTLQTDGSWPSPFP